MMQFNDLLKMAGFAPRDVAIMLHNPTMPDQRSLLMALVDDTPELFEAYQDNHPRNPEATLKSRKIAASFVVGNNNEARFVELYSVVSWQDFSAAAMDLDPRRQTLRERFTVESYADQAIRTGRDGRAIFELSPLPGLADLKGRLLVLKPPGRAYMRLAENSNLPVVAIQRIARFSPPAPDWNDFVVTGVEMRGLPRDWQARLREWRGIYHIIDTSDGARYVGAAYGETNLLGRWQAHVAREVGVTVELGRRDPAGFRFSILELVSPTAITEQVWQAEVRWKQRLATREWGLNRN